MCGLSSLLGLSRPPTPTFAEWARTATTNDIHTLFTTLMKDGASDGQSAAFPSSKLQFFEKLSASFPSQPSGELEITSIISHLIHSHPYLTEQIKAASPTLSLLLLSHANFPFTTETMFTKDALLRSLGLLTHSSKPMFSQSASLGQTPTIRPRTESSRIDFIFSALAQPSPPTGAPTQDDVLDVLCRIPYPRPTSYFQAQRRPITDLVPLAERLRMSGGVEREELKIPILSLRPLADLVNAMRNDGGVAGENVLEGKGSLDGEEFREWAETVKLLIPLHKLFCVFIEPV